VRIGKQCTQLWVVLDYVAGVLGRKPVKARKLRAGRSLHRLPQGTRAFPKHRPQVCTRHRIPLVWWRQECDPEGSPCPLRERWQLQRRRMRRRGAQPYCLHRKWHKAAYSLAQRSLSSWRALRDIPSVTWAALDEELKRVRRGARRGAHGEEAWARAARAHTATLVRTAHGLLLLQKRASPGLLSPTLTCTYWPGTT
jgi:hypothetical protein